MRGGKSFEELRRIKAEICTDEELSAAVQDVVTDPSTRVGYNVASLTWSDGRQLALRSRARGAYTLFGVLNVGHLSTQLNCIVFHGNKLVPALLTSEPQSASLGEAMLKRAEEGE